MFKIPLYSFQRLQFESAYKFILPILPCLKLDLCTRDCFSCWPVHGDLIPPTRFETSFCHVPEWLIVSSVMFSSRAAMWQGSCDHFIYLLKSWLNLRGLQWNCCLFPHVITQRSAHREPGLSPCPLLRLWASAALLTAIVWINTSSSPPAFHSDFLSLVTCALSAPPRKQIYFWMCS